MISYTAFDDDALAQMAGPGLVRRAAKLLPQCTWDGEAIKVGDLTVLVGDYVVRLGVGGPAKGRCPCPAAGVCVHVLAATMFVRDSLPPTTAPASTAPAPTAPASTAPATEPPVEQPAPAKDQGPTPATKRITAQAIEEIEATVAAGISHAGRDAVDRLQHLATTARGGGLPLLSRLLGTAAALLDGLVQGSDQVSERQVITGLAQAWGLSHALDAADADAWPGLRGVVRRDFTQVSSITLLPLGATWWVTPAGSRGLTLTAWDAEAGVVRTATTARPVGVDPSFVPDLAMMALWGVQLSTLLQGPFRLDGSRMADDGSLSATARRVTPLPGGITEASLRDLAVRLKPGPQPVGFVDDAYPVALLAVTGQGDMVIDEVNQQVAWTLPTTEGTWHLRQSISPDVDQRVDALMSFQHDQRRLSYMLARRVVEHGRTDWQPATLFLRQSGKTAMVCLDFPDPRLVTMAPTFRKTLALMRQRWRDAPAPPQLPRTAALRLADDIADLVVDLAATGRLAPSPEQTRRLQQLGSLSDSLALATASKMIDQLLHQPDAAALLRLQLVADRVARLSADL